MNLFLKPNSENVYLKNVNLIDKIQWTRITLSKTLSLSYIEDFIVIQIFSQTWCAPSFTTIWVWSWCFLLINKVKCSDLCGFKCFCCWTEILPCVYDFAICTECANITQVAHGIWYGMVWYGGGGIQLQNTCCLKNTVDTVSCVPCMLCILHTPAVLQTSYHKVVVITICWIHFMKFIAKDPSCSCRKWMSRGAWKKERLFP